MSFSMSSIKITLNQADGSQQTFVRSVEKGGGDGTAASDLASLRTHMGDVQSELNAALTVLVDKEKAASATSGKVQDTKRSGDQDDEEDEDDDDDDDNHNETNGSTEPPEKIRKTV